MKAILLTLFVTLSLCGCSKPKSESGGPGESHANMSAKFYFSDPDSLYCFDTDSLTCTKIFHGYDASISPDGTTIAFTDDTEAIRPSEWARYIALYDRATKRSHRLTSIEGRDSFNAQFSPDGKTLVFDHWDSTSGRWFIARVGVDNTDYRVVTPAHGLDYMGYYQPSWRTDGSGFICHDLDTVYEFSPDGKLLVQMPMKDVVPMAEYGMSSSSHIFSDPINHRIVAEAGSDMEDDTTIEHYGIFVYDTQKKQSMKISPDSLHAWDPHWVEAKHVFYFRGYTSKDLASTPSNDGHVGIPWRMYAVGADGAGLRMVFDPAKK